MTRLWVTFMLGHEVIVADMEMDALPRQGEEVIIKGITYGVSGVQWTILPDVKVYSDIIIFLHLVE